jgi:DNA invertase Pin-like site-specific DNA recombinase
MAPVRTVREHAARVGAEVVAEYNDEAESGTRTDRPELAKAIEHARRAGAVLVVSRLDRLGRKASHLLAIRDGGVRVEALDVPGANDFVYGVLALVAEQEARAIAERTRAALGAIRERVARGERHVSKAGRVVERLGKPNGAAPLRRHAAVHGNRAGVEGARRAAVASAEAVRWAVEELRAAGVTSNKAIARALNERGLPSRCGGRWAATSVKRMLGYLEARR